MPKKIFEQKLYLTKEQQEQMVDKSGGVYFDWAPNTQNYFSHVDINLKKDKELINLLKKAVDEKESSL